MNIEDKRYVQELCYKYYSEYLDRIMQVEHRLTELDEKLTIIEQWAKDKFARDDEREGEKN